MVVQNFQEVESVQLMEGVKRRIVIGEKEGAPNFIMRIFDVDQGHSTPYHEHPWEHEVFVLEGKAAVKDVNGTEKPIAVGDTVFIPPSEKHCLINKGDGLFRFMCLIPTGAE